MESDYLPAGYFQSLYRAYVRCRRHKRAGHNAQVYDMHLLDHLCETAGQLKHHAWSPSHAICFVSGYPKPREIHAACFADRVVHHWLVPRLEQLYEPLFIADSYANRKNKGSHKAVARLQKHMRQCQAASGQPYRRVYYLQLDIANYFNSIDRATLYAMLKKTLLKAQRRAKAHGNMAEKAEWLLAQGLCYRLLSRKPSLQKQGSAASFARVPEHKRFSLSLPGKGLPIGNLTSQFFANVYMHACDQFIKHHLKCRHYVRYVDDFVLVASDCGQLQRWQQQISQFLAHNLTLKLRHPQVLQPLSNGIDFLGYVVFPHHRLVRKRVVRHFRQKLDQFERGLWQRHQHGRLLCLRPAQRDRLWAVVASYLGHFKQANSHALCQKLAQQHPWLAKVFAPIGPHLPLIPLWQPPKTTVLLGDQYRYFKRRYSAAICLLQVGPYYEAYGPDARGLMALFPAYFSPLLGAARRRWASLQARMLCVHIAHVVKRLRRWGLPYIQVVEEGHLMGGRKRRVLQALFVNDKAQTNAGGVVCLP